MGTVSVRYIVDDVEASIAFYTQHLGFNVEWPPVTHDPVGHPAPVFAALSRGDLRLMLTSPDSPIVVALEGSRAEPGGFRSATRSLPALVAGRSLWKIHQVMR